MALVVGVALDQPLHAALLHLPLHHRQCLLQVVVADLNPDPAGLLHRRRGGLRRRFQEGDGGGEAAEHGIHGCRRRSGARSQG